jgi:hypothetical protein
MSRRQIDLDALRESNRRWLAPHGLLERPWFILASGPDPTIPPDITGRALLVCINNAPATAARMGLGSPRLTFRNPNKEWKSVAGCKLPLILWLSNKRGPEVIWLKLFTARGIAGDIRTMRKSTRDVLNRHFLGSALSNVGQMHKPSTALFAVFYGLFVGAPEIILGGVTLEKDGYSYTTALPGIHKHRDEDFAAMQMLAEQYPAVSTSEAEVAAATGLRLFR